MAKSTTSSQGTPTSLTLRGKSVAARVFRGKPGRVRLVIKEGELQVYTPDGSLAPADALLAQKAAWIVKHTAKQALAQGVRQAYMAELTTAVDLLGVRRKLQFAPAENTRYRLQGEDFWIWAPPGYLSRKKQLLVFALRRLAENYLARRTHELATLTDSTINVVRVKNHRSKWGSCSSKRNINLNWHLILMDKSVIDYVIIHELMHLREMNHSPRFWAQVATYYPDYKTAERLMREQQWKIGVYES